jgi:hypothetical protein
LGDAAILFRKEQETFLHESGTSSGHPVMVETFLEMNAGS